MRKAIIATALLIAANQSFAMTHFLVSQWLESGSNFCKYDNGTVLNVGARVCPLQINS